jgi:hypothetical protein
MQAEPKSREESGQDGDGEVVELMRQQEVLGERRL